MKSDIELARALVTSANQSKTKRSEERPVTAIINGTASEDSTNGFVSVRLQGSMTADDITIPCVGAISSGQTVVIAATGAPGRARALVAIGAIGAGDANAASLRANVASVSKLASRVSTLSPNAIATSALAVSGKDTQSSTEQPLKHQIAALTTFARLAMPKLTPTLSTSDIVSVASLLPEWEAGKSYKKGEAIKRNGTIYKVSQDIAKSSDIYPPETAGASLYAAIDVATDGVRIWHAPTMAEDAYSLGERAHYPDKDGAIYISMRDGNTSVPGQDTWWKREE